MGMSVDEAIDNLETIGEYYTHDFSDPYEEYEPLSERELKSLYMAIDSIRKYQKIDGIVRAYYNDEYADKLDIEVIEMISEVLCDGNDGV